MSAGDDAGANNMFGRVLELCPNHPTARDMQRVAQSHLQGSAVVAAQNTAQPITVVPNGTPIAPTVTPEGGMNFSQSLFPRENALYGPENRYGSARAMLVIGSTLHGLYFGAFLPGAFAPSVAGEVIAGGTLLGGALGVTSSLLLTQDGATSGQAHAMFLVPFVGLYAGVGMVLLTTGSSGSGSTQATFGLLALGSALGIGTGIGLTRTRLTGGQINLAASSSIWGMSVGSQLGLAISGGSASSQAIGGVLLAGLGVGGVAGGLLAANYRISADRMWWINLSIAIGDGLFAGIGTLLTSRAGPSAIALGAGLGGVLGVLGGALFGVLITRNYDRYWEEIHPQQEQNNRNQPGATAMQTRARRAPARPQFMFVPNITTAPGTGAPLIGLGMMGTF